MSDVRRVGGMPWPQIGATQYHSQLGLSDKGRAIKGLVVCNNWDLEPLDLLSREIVDKNIPVFFLPIILI